MDERHLSATQINMLARCERQYEFRYINGIKRPPAGAVVAGTAYHAGTEESLRAKLQNRLIDVGNLCDLVAQTFDDVVDAEPEGVDWGEDSPGVLKDSAIEVAKIYHEHMTPTLDPIAVEVGWRVSLDEDWHVEGFSDLVYRDKAGAVVADHKLSKRRTQAEKHIVQLSLYTLGLRVDLGIDPIRAEIHQGIRPGGRAGASVVVAQTDSFLSEEFVREFLLVYARKIESGLFAPTGIGNWVCSPEYCGYWDLCVGRRMK